MKTLLLLILLSPVFCFCQKIKVNETDRFTNQRRIETYRVRLKQGVSCGLAVSYRSADSTYFIRVSGYGCLVGQIGSSDRFIFLLENKDTVTVTSIGSQDYDITPEQYGTVRSYTHEYLATPTAIKKLSLSKLVSVRAYFSNGYQDMDIPEKKQDGLMRLSKLFLDELRY